MNTTETVHLLWIPIMEVFAAITCKFREQEKREIVHNKLSNKKDEQQIIYTRPILLMRQTSRHILKETKKQVAYE